MSRRKQAFPIRVEGNRLHLSAESGPSYISGEPTSDKILPVKCNSSTPDEDIHNRPPNILSNGEFIVTSTVSDEPKTSKFSCDESETSEFEDNEQNFTQIETGQDILPSVKVESPVFHEEDTAAAATQACSDFSAVKEQWCTFRVDVKKQSVVNAQEPKPGHQSLICANNISEEVGKNPEICRDVNVRTSLVCKAGTEIKIVLNTSAEKVKVQCVTNLTENVFEIHKKPPKQIEGSSTKDNALGIVEQVCPLQEDLESKDTVPRDVLLCAEANDKTLEPLILSCMDSVPDVEESSISTSPIDERSHCTGVASSPEPDSSTTLIDECELNIQNEGSCVGSLHVVPDELIVTGDIYSEPNTDVLADDEALPPIKVEPCIILKEEQEPLNIPSCIDFPGTVKDEVFSSFPAEGEKHIAGVSTVQELKPPCLSHSHAHCGCKAVVANSFETNDSNARSFVTRRVTRQSVRAKKEEAQRLAEFTINTSEAAKEILVKAVEAHHKDCCLNTEEQEHGCSRLKKILGTDDPALEAILPCVDIDQSFLKEQEPVIISSCKSLVIRKNTCAAFLDGEKKINTSKLKQPYLDHGAASYDVEGTESAVEECRDLSVKTHAYRTRNKGNQNNYAEDDDDDDEEGGITKPRGNAAKVGRKRRQKTKGSRRRVRAHQTKNRNQGYTELEDSQLKAILPCVDPSLLTGETEPGIISACKDPIASETNLFILPVDEGKQSECKANMPSEHTQMSYEELEGTTEMSEDSTTSNLESHIPRNRSKRRVKPCVTDEEIQCMVDFTKEALEQREKKLQQIREAVYRKRASETDEQRQARLEKDKLRQRKRRAEETEEQREKRLLTMRLHKRMKRSMNSATGLQKNFLDYYMEEMFKYPETQEEQGSPLNMIVSIDPSWVVRTVEKQQFKCAVETEEQRRTRLEKDMLRQRKKRAEETAEQRAKRLETMRINKRIRRAMETEEQRLRRLEYSRERQLFRRLNETDEQRKERLEREKLRQREKRAAESTDERALRLQAARERMRMRLSEPKVTDMIENLLSSDSLSS